MMSPTTCAKGEPSKESGPGCLAFHKKRIDQGMNEADRLGIPMFLSEFGACMNSDTCAREID
jgi:hypothetical protein